MRDYAEELEYFNKTACPTVIQVPRRFSTPSTPADEQSAAVAAGVKQVEPVLPDSSVNMSEERLEWDRFLRWINHKPTCRFLRVRDV